MKGDTQLTWSMLDVWDFGSSGIPLVPCPLIDNTNLQQWPQQSTLSFQPIKKWLKSKRKKKSPIEKKEGWEEACLGRSWISTHFSLRINRKAGNTIEAMKRHPIPSGVLFVPRLRAFYCGFLLSVSAVDGSIVTIKMLPTGTRFFQQLEKAVCWCYTCATLVKCHDQHVIWLVIDTWVTHDFWT